MSILTVPIPLFDTNMAVEAYMLSSHDGTKLFNVVSPLASDDVFANPGLEMVEKIGIESFTGDKPLFAEISHMQMITGIPQNMNIDSNQLICVVSAKLLKNEEAVGLIYKLHESGYKIALDGYPTNPNLPIMEIIEFILLSCKHHKFTDTYYYVKKHNPQTKIIILRIPDMEVFNKLKNDKKAYFSGCFYSQPITKKSTTLSPVKVNLLHLLNDVNKEDFDLSEIVKTIERDPYLAISLLRFINTDTKLSIRNKIESISQATAILGQKAVRQWTTVSLSVSLAEDRPSEITKLSLVRAKFAEELASAFEMAVLQHELFIAGLFSLLDVMLEKPMTEALNEVAVNQRVQDVLLDKKGPFVPILELVYAYERGDWDKVTILVVQNDIDLEQIRTAYVNALTWYSNLLNSIDTPDSEQDI